MRASSWLERYRRFAAHMRTRAAGSTSSATAHCASSEDRRSIHFWVLRQREPYRASVSKPHCTARHRRTSSPALEESDILSLLLFNAPSNELGAGQRTELAVQAATLASGFVVSPAISAVGEKLGLDFLQLEPTSSGSSASFRLSAGREIWKGLFLTYSREFSSDPYNEVLAEYELSRYLRLRAMGSDAPGARTRESLFHRVERFGVDVLFFFSY